MASKRKSKSNPGTPASASPSPSFSPPSISPSSYFLSSLSSPPSPSLSTEVRCWGTVIKEPIMSLYHCHQWGRPSLSFPLFPRSPSSFPSSPRHIRHIFASLSYQIFQAGLSWRCVLNKIPSINAAFHSFDVDKLSGLSEREIEAIGENEGVIRNKLKIRAIVNNARLVAQMEREKEAKRDFRHGFLHLLLQDVYQRNYSERERLLPKGRLEGSYMRSDFDTPSHERKETDGVHPSLAVWRIAQRLRDRGFKFVGDTVVLCFLQHIGLMNHHDKECPQWTECEREWRELKESIEKEERENKELEVEGAGGEEQSQEEQQANKKGKKRPLPAVNRKNEASAVVPIDQTKGRSPSVKSKRAKTIVTAAVVSSSSSSLSSSDGVIETLEKKELTVVASRGRGRGSTRH